jgi:hypothetical protein
MLQKAVLHFLDGLEKRFLEMIIGFDILNTATIDINWLILVF